MTSKESSMETDSSNELVPVLRLKRPQGGVTPSMFRLPGSKDSISDLKVGRNGEECNVFLYVDEHPSFLSRVHAIFSVLRENSGISWTLSDHKSVNGVFVNGTKLAPNTPFALQNGDRVFFGNPQHSFFVEYEFGLVTPDAVPHLPAFANLNRKRRLEDLEVSDSDSGLKVPTVGPRSRTRRTLSSNQSISSNTQGPDMGEDVIENIDSELFLNPTSFQRSNSISYQTDVGCDSLQPTADDSDADTGNEANASPPKNKRRKINVEEQFSMLLQLMNYRMVHDTVLGFLPLPDLFRLRGLCKKVRSVLEIFLAVHVVNVQWSHTWNQRGFESFIGACNGIETLNASGCYNLEDRHVNVLASKVPNIQNLDLSGCSRISHKALGFLAENCTQLRSVRLRACKRIATPEGVQPLEALVKNNPELIELDFRCCNMDDNTLQNILVFTKNLKSLDIGSTGFAEVSDRVLNTLAKNCPHLEHLGVMCCKFITDQGVAALGQGCGASLKSFIVHCCFDLTDASMISLAKYCKQLEVLNVHRCLKITDDGIIRFVQACGRDLKSLDISACRISDFALGAIASNCPNLLVLDARSCEQISSAAISNLVRQCTQLQHLDLSGCELVDDKVIDAINEHANSLKQLEIGKENKVSEQGWNILARKASHSTEFQYF